MAGTDMALFSGAALPAYLINDEVDATTKALMGGFQGKYISIRGGVFRKIVNGVETQVTESRSLNVIVVRAAEHVSRVYYAGKYEEGAAEPPVCWSSDGVTPDHSVVDPQSDACATCKWNISGSGENDTRACRFNQRVALLLDGDMEGDIYTLSLPAKSLFGKGEGDKMPLQQYVKYLAGHKVSVTAVVTEMRFDISSSTPKLTFRPIRPLTEEEYRLALEAANDEDAIEGVKLNIFAAGSIVDGASEHSEGVVAQAIKTQAPVQTAAAPAAPAPAVPAAPATEEEQVAAQIAALQARQAALAHAAAPAAPAPAPAAPAAEPAKPRRRRRSKAEMEAAAAAGAAGAAAPAQATFTAPPAAAPAPAPAPAATLVEQADNDDEISQQIAKLMEQREAQQRAKALAHAQSQGAIQQAAAHAAPPVAAGTVRPAPVAPTVPSAQSIMDAWNSDDDDGTDDEEE